MNPEIIVALISLLGTLGGSLGGILVSSKMTNYRLQQLEARVDKHNNLVERMTASEIRIRNIEEAVKEGQR